MSKQITKKTKLNEILSINPKAAEILFENGLMCIGCPMAIQETLEQGCKAHGMGNEEIEELIKKVNKK
jgi:hybrid cluster-associated redox disulfide protein